MYRPTDPGESVVVYNGETEAFDREGEWTGDTGEYGEHFQISFPDGTAGRFHYEDIKPAVSNPQ